MTALLIIIGSCFAANIGFNVGKSVERAKWNKLTQEGKLPRLGSLWSYCVPRR